MWASVHVILSLASLIALSPQAPSPKTPQGKLIPTSHNGEVPLFGMVSPGFPSPAEEELLDTMGLDEYLIENREATYLLKVTGNSMLDAGIQPGDLVIVERTNAPRVGDIVIAEVDGEWTMKYGDPVAYGQKTAGRAR